MSRLRKSIPGLEESRGVCRFLSDSNLYQRIFPANLIPECVLRAALIFYFLRAYPVIREENEKPAHEVADEILTAGGYDGPADQIQLGHLSEGITAITTGIADIES